MFCRRVLEYLIKLRWGTRHLSKVAHLQTRLIAIKCLKASVLDRVKSSFYPGGRVLFLTTQLLGCICQADNSHAVFYSRDDAASKHAGARFHFLCFSSLWYKLNTWLHVKIKNGPSRGKIVLCYGEKAFYIRYWTANRGLLWPYHNNMIIQAVRRRMWTSDQDDSFLLFFYVSKLAVSKTG